MALGTHIQYYQQTPSAPTQHPLPQFPLHMAPNPKKLLPAVLSAQKQRPPKKFLSSLITDVYSKVSSHTDLDNLRDEFLPNVAWKFFHADVTNNHVELILAVVFYSSVVCGSVEEWTLLALDKEKLNSLLQRVLQTTLKSAIEEPLVDFEYLSYLFLSVVLRQDPDVLLNHELFERWLDSVLDAYTEHFLSGEFSVSSSKTASALVYFLGVAKSENIAPIVDTVDSKCFYSVFASCEDPELKQLIQEQELKPDLTDFTKIQRKSRELGFNFLGDCLLPYDLKKTDLVENLVDLDIDNLSKLAKTAGYEGDVDDADFLADLVIRKTIPQLENRRYVSEQELFDLFNHTPTLGLRIPSYFTSKEPLAKWRYQLYSSINRHLYLCLQRLNITKEGIQGTSKYFPEIEKIEEKGSDLEISLKSGGNGIREGHYVVLLHMEKPVKHEYISRVCKYGIMKAKLVKVTRVGPKLLVVKLNEPDRKYNRLLSLSSQTGVLLLPSLTGGVVESLKAKEDKRLWKVNGIDESFTKTTKRRKGENDTIKVFEYNSCKFELTNSNPKLTKDQSTALLEILSSPVSFIKCAPHSGTDILVRAFLETILLNSDPKSPESCLVILPTKHHVKRFRLNDALLSVTHKSGDIQSSRKQADRLLQRVSQIADFLGLQEFDFTSSLRNAVMFYESHIQPRWNEYLKTLKDTIASVSKYPFARFEHEKDLPVKDALDKVVQHYAEITRTFSHIQRLLLLDKADIENHPEDIERALCALHPVVICSPESLNLVGKKFEHVVSFAGIETEAAISNSTKKLAFLGEVDNFSCDVLATLEDSVRLETGKTKSEKTQYNPGLSQNNMVIKTPASEKLVNVDEATYIVGLFQYMRLLGYRNEDILLVVTSPYMKLLVEEILESKEISQSSTAEDGGSFEFGWPLIQLASEPLVPSRYVLFSAHGDLSFSDLRRAMKFSSHGFYAFSSQSLPVGEKLSTLKVYTGANRVENTDDRENGQKSHVIEDSTHMAEYVEQMLKIRKAHGGK